jgi:4-hydroxybenzoate polyprenyltransferase
MRRILDHAATVLEMIKFQHTVFALPFALTGMVMAANGLPTIRQAFWIVAAAVFARTSAMSFNRWADADIDARNPRTSVRAIPAGLLSKRYVFLFTIVSAVLFVISAGMLSKLALALSPVALGVLFGYSYMKRVSALSHFVLGLALGIAPIGAWIAVRGEFDLVPLLLGLAVLLWTAGFDLIYACQDFDFDRTEGLFSFPAKYGIGRALQLSVLLHAACIIVLTAAGWVYGFGGLYYVGVAVVAVLLIAEHLLVNPRDLSRINIAFFTVNSWVGTALFIFAAADVFF